MINRIISIKFITAVTFIGSCFFIASCENNINDVKALSANTGGIDIGKDVAIYMSEGGKMNAKLTAPIMKKYLQKVTKRESSLKLNILMYALRQAR